MMKNPYYRVKHWMKLARWQMRRWQVARRWGMDILEKTPAVIGNAMPKSGSHLIIQVLEGLVEFGPFVNPGFPPINRFEDNSRLNELQMLNRIQQMKPGDIAYGYLHAREPFISAVTGKNRAFIFIYRDPRDVLVSHVFYAKDMHAGHGMHRYYNEELDTMEERLNAAIEGVQAGKESVSSVAKRYAPYLGWFEVEGGLCLRFEDLILDRKNSLGQILDYLQTFGFTPEIPREEAIQQLEHAIAPKKSGTFRKGQPGNWREHFTDENKARFKEVAGDLLQRLGYEQNADW